MTETSDKVSNNIINFHLTVHFIKKNFVANLRDNFLVYNFWIFWLIKEYFQNQRGEAADGGRSDTREPHISVAITFSDIGDGQVPVSGTWPRVWTAECG